MTDAELGHASAWTAMGTNDSLQARQWNVGTSSRKLWRSPQKTTTWFTVAALEISPPSFVSVAYSAARAASRLSASSINSASSREERQQSWNRHARSTLRRAVSISPSAARPDEMKRSGATARSAHVCSGRLSSHAFASFRRRFVHSDGSPSTVGLGDGLALGAEVERGAPPWCPAAGPAPPAGTGFPARSRRL